MNTINNEILIQAFNKLTKMYLANNNLTKDDIRIKRINTHKRIAVVNINNSLKDFKYALRNSIATYKVFYSKASHAYRLYISRDLLDYIANNLEVTIKEII